MAKSLSLKSRGARRRRWDLGRLQHSFRAATRTPKRCSKTPPNTGTDPNISHGLRFRKAAVRHTEGQWEDADRTGHAGSTHRQAGRLRDGASSQGPFRGRPQPLKPLGTKLLPKRTAARYLCICWTLDPGKREARRTERQNVPISQFMYRGHTAPQIQARLPGYCLSPPGLLLLPRHSAKGVFLPIYLSHAFTGPKFQVRSSILGLYDYFPVVLLVHFTTTSAFHFLYHLNHKNTVHLPPAGGTVTIPTVTTACMTSNQTQT